MKKEQTRVILIGRTTAGKTTLCQRISHEELNYRKTQTITVVNGRMIDTPGEYLERRSFRGALMVSSVDADVVVLVQDATENGTMFPPSFSSMFSKPTVGVVTKRDLATSEQLDKAQKYLRLAGVKQTFIISNVTGEGIAELIHYLGLEM